MVVHIVPMSAFRTMRTIDIETLESRGKFMRPLGGNRVPRLPSESRWLGDSCAWSRRPEPSVHADLPYGGRWRACACCRLGRMGCTCLVLRMRRI